MDSNFNMVFEKLENLARMLGKAYKENLRIRLKKGSPHYQEVADMVGNRKISMEFKKLLNIS